MEKMNSTKVKAEKVDEKHLKVTLPKVEVPPYGWIFDGWYENIGPDATQDAKKIGESGETVVVNTDELYAQSPNFKPALKRSVYTDPDRVEYFLNIEPHYVKISKRKDSCADVDVLCWDGVRFAQAIPVDDKHADKINAAIAQAEGKARTRRLNYDDVKRLCKRFENVYNVYKYHLDGCSFSYLTGVEDYGGYYGIPYGTKVYATNRKGKWYLVGAERERCNYAYGAKSTCVVLSDDAKEEIMNGLENWF